MTIPIWSSVTAPGIWNTFRNRVGAVRLQGYILIIDENRREQSEAYQRKLGEIAAIGVENIAVVHTIPWRNRQSKSISDTEQPSFDAAMDRLLEIMDRFPGRSIRFRQTNPAPYGLIPWTERPGTFYMTRGSCLTGPMKAAMIRGTVLH